MYTCTVQAAIAAKGDRTAFIETVDALMNDFRGNVRGIAEKHDVEQAMDKQGRPQTDKDGNAVYKVPGSLSSAKYVLNRGFEYGIDFGSIKEPQAFSAIRDAASVAAAESSAANATPLDKQIATAQGHLDAIAKSLNALDLPSLKALNKALAAYRKDTQAKSKTTAAKAA